MIKLIRNTRKKLILGKPLANRTRNYLKYAIGEIVSVMIGMRITLSLNNWNDQRIDQTKECYLG